MAWRLADYIRLVFKRPEQLNSTKQEGAMVSMKDRWATLLLLAFIPLFLLVSGCTENSATGAGKIANSSLTVKGKVQKISLEEGIMVVAPPKGERVTLKITPQIAVKGGTLKEITRFQPVQAVYTVNKDENSVVSLEILPQGSCGGS
jgi:hypothetical protein